MGNNISLRAKVQSMGGFLTNMVIPNMGAFIAWGLITALFIPTGWLPNEYLSQLVDPTIKYLLPLLLAYSGGMMVGGKKGAVLGSVGTMGLIIGSDISMFLGAMIVGPLGGWIVKKTDQFFEERIKAGFEMVVSNFTVGIIGMFLMIICYAFIGPIITVANDIVADMVEALVQTGMLPLLAIVNEPAKVLFLNNVIDQGIYYPLGMQQAAEQGKSIYFMLASNPGPGLGLLLAYSYFGKGVAKKTAPGAIIIHFFGGIHEMYFPYVLMKPLTIVAMIAGAMSGIVTFQLLDAGLVAGPSPGSIFAYLMLTPKGGFIPVIAGVTVATVVTFLVTAIILKADKSDSNSDDFSGFVEQSKEMKNEGKLASEKISSNSDNPSLEKITNIAFACDAGMGSSAMGATAFRKKLKNAGIEDITVKHYRIEDVPAEANVAVIHKNLTQRAMQTIDESKIIAIESYLQDESIDQLLEQIINSRK